MTSKNLFNLQNGPESVDPNHLAYRFKLFPKNLVFVFIFSMTINNRQSRPHARIVSCMIGAHSHKNRTMRDCNVGRVHIVVFLSSGEHCPPGGGKIIPSGFSVWICLEAVVAACAGNIA